MNRMANEEAKLFVAGLPDSVSEDVLKPTLRSDRRHRRERQSARRIARPEGRAQASVTDALSTPAEAQAADAPRPTAPLRRGEVHLGPSIPRPSLPAAAWQSRAVQARARSSGRRRSRHAGPRRRWERGPGGPGAPDRTLYVGNLPYDCTQQDIETLINGVASGQVARVHLPMDPDGRKRGFGFVTMTSAESAKAASEALKQADLRGRRLIINLAHPKGDRPARSGRRFRRRRRRWRRLHARGGGGGFGGPPMGGGGGGGGFSGGPPPQRKTFDDRRASPHEQRTKTVPASVASRRKFRTSRPRTTGRPTRTTSSERASGRRGTSEQACGGPRRGK